MTASRRIIIVISSLAGALGCRDASTPPRRLTRDDLSSGTAAFRRSAAELHRVNRMDWVGVAHNRMVEAATRELTTNRTNMRDLCSHMIEWVRQPGNLPSLSGQLSPDQVDAVASAIAAQPACARQLHHNETGLIGATSTPSSARMQFVSLRSVDDAALLNGALDDIESALNSATTPGGLASSLSPIYDESLSMPDTLAQWTQTAIAIAQSSFEEWYDNDGAAQAAVYDPIAAELDQCYSDPSYSGTFTDQNDAQSYTCSDGRWLLSALRGRRSAPQPYRLAAMSALDCNTSILEGAVYVGASDFVAGRVAMAFTYFFGPVGFGAAAAGAGVASTVAMGLYGYHVYKCNRVQ